MTIEHSDAPLGEIHPPSNRHYAKVWVSATASVDDLAGIPPAWPPPA